MIFNSLTFFIFFILVLCFYFSLPHRLQNRMLLVASYVFYGWWDWRFLSLIFISTVTDYLCGIQIHNHQSVRRKNVFLWILERTRLKNQKPLDAVPQECLLRFRNDLKEVIQYLQELNIDIILSSYPALISNENINEYLEIFLDHRRFYVELSLRGILDASTRFNYEIKTIADENRTHFLDTKEAIPQKIQYFADNAHYTEEGALLVAAKFSK